MPIRVSNLSVRTLTDECKTENVYLEGQFGTKITIVTFTPRDLDAELSKKDAIISEAEAQKQDILSMKADYFSIEDQAISSNQP